MATHTLTARFRSRGDAECARDRLRQLGVHSDQIELAPSAVGSGVDLRARVDDAYAEMAVRALRECGVLEHGRTQHEARSADWIAHHSGAVTSAGVPPGQGDAETGS